MAGITERAELVARLSLRDDFSRPLSRVESNFRGSMSKIAGHASRGVQNAARNIGRLGVVAGAAVAFNVKQGISSLADLEDAVTSVDGAVKQVGKGWTTTGATVARIANEIEANVDRAFDDKAITQASQTLIRYGKISEDNLRPAMEVMTDLAARTGDVDSAATLLAKALADPANAAGKLSRQGVILTKHQQEMIATMVEAGDVAGAQAFLLAKLEKTTKGAAKAMHGPYRDAMLTLADVTEDAQRALAVGFLPLLGRVADELSKAVEDPKVMAQIREFGEGLADGFDKALGVAKQIPWQQIGDSMKIAGAGAKFLFDAFTQLPPWVQTAVLTGWGLNKLTGGALGSIVGELGKGLIKGVLGINAGVVNVRGAVVNGGGGAGAGGAAAAGGSSAAAITAAGLLPVITLAFTEWGKSVVNTPEGAAAGIRPLQSNAAPISIAGWNNLLATMDGIHAGIDYLNNKPTAGDGAVVTSVNNVRDKAEANRLATQTGIEALRGNFDKNLQPLPEKISQKQERHFNRLRERVEASRIATVNSKSAIVSSGHSDRNAIVTAIANNKPVSYITINVPPAANFRQVIRYKTGGQLGQSQGRGSGPSEEDH